MIGAVVGCLLAASVPARAQAAGATRPLSSIPVAIGAAVDTAPLVLRGRVVTVFRAPFGASSPRDRATAAEARYRELVARDVPDSAAAEEQANGVLITAGGRGLFFIVPADAPSDTARVARATVTEVLMRLDDVLALERESRSVPLLLRAAAISLLATLLFFIALRLLVLARRRLVERLATAAAPRLRDIGIGGVSLLRAEQVLRGARRATVFVSWAAGLFFAYLWLTFVLERFAYSRTWGEALGGYLQQTVQNLALGVLRAIPGLFTVALILVVTRWAAGLVRGFFDVIEARSVEVPWVHPDTANPTRRIVVAMLWLFAVVVAYPYLPGSGSDVFKGVSVFAGLVLSLGSSGVMNQAMSGLVLMYSRALKPGDYVRVGEVEGTVTELGMLSTKVRTTKREEVTLPNAVVVTATVKNYSRLAAAEGGVVLHTSVTIGYDTPWRQVHGMLLTAADRTAGLRRDPPPYVHQTALSDFYIEYELNAAMEHPEDRVSTLSALHQHIVDVFNEFGVQIMSPHYETDPRAPLVVPRERWNAAPASRAAAAAVDGDGRRQP